MAAELRDSAANLYALEKRVSRSARGVSVIQGDPQGLIGRGQEPEWGNRAALDYEADRSASRLSTDALRAHSTDW